MGKEHFLLRGELTRLRIKFFIVIHLSKLRRKLKRINLTCNSVIDSLAKMRLPCPRFLSGFVNLQDYLS